MGRSRGQILLVAAFAMAIIFVALALILNTAIYTENLATRETVGGHEVLDFQESVIEVGAVLLRRTNAEESTYQTLRSTYRERIRNYSDAELAHALTRGTIRNVTLLETHNGTLLNQSTVSNFENEGGNSTWQLVHGVTDARAVRFEVTDVDSNATLRINATNGSETWGLLVNESNGSFGVSVQTPTNGSSSRMYSTESLEIRPTEGSIENRTWADLEFQNAFPDEFDLWIKNGSNATGTYRLIVDEAVNQIDGSDYADRQLRPVIYNATLQIALLQDKLEYRANVTIEPDGTNAR
ncbi:MAG: hypothetical protein ABEJ84_02940 [Halodesulfurarchaeum sp.]